MIVINGSRRAARFLVIAATVTVTVAGGRGLGRTRWNRPADRRRRSDR
jgi:hypothetical protein